MKWKKAFLSSWFKLVENTGLKQSKKRLFELLIQFKTLVGKIAIHFVRVIIQSIKYSFLNISISLNFIEFREFGKFIIKNITTFFKLQIYILLFILILNITSNPLLINFILSLLEVESSHPGYYPTMLIGINLLTIVARMMIMINVLLIWVLLINLIYLIVKLIYNIIHQLYFGKVSKKYNEIKYKYEKLLHKKIKPKTKYFIYIPTGLILIKVAKDIFNKVHWEKIIDEINISLYFLIPLISIVYWYFILDWRKKEKNKSEINYYLFSKYNNQIIVKEITSIILLFALLVWFVIPQSHEYALEINNNITVEADKYYQKKYIEFKNIAYEKYDSVHKKMYDDFKNLKKHLSLGDDVVTLSLNKIVENKKLIEKIKNYIFILLFYSGIIGFIIFIVIKLTLYKQYLKTFIRILAKTIKTLVFFGLIGYLIFNLFELNISDEFSLGGLISFAFILSFNLNDFDNDDEFFN